MSNWQSRKEQAINLWRTESVPFITAYVLSGLLCILVPAIKYKRSTNAYYNSYYYQYQQQNGSGDNNGGGEYDINNCKWWNFRCTSVYVNENGEYVQQEQGENGQYYSTPSWFSGWGGNRSRDSRDGGVSNSGGLKFVYAWQVLMTLGVLAYGAFVVYKFRPSGGASREAGRMALQSLLAILFVWTNTAFMGMWMLANGSINVEGREIENVGGFYNQFSVMMFVTNFWLTLWGIVFCAIIGFSACRKPTGSATEQTPASHGTYLPYSEPSVSVSNSNPVNTKNTFF